MKHLLSIIVPVYNVADYLEACLDSILAQTYTDFECIIVDDGSKDSSPSICDKYALKDSRVKVLHQENTGLSGARNAAMKLAKGDLVAFVDSDDSIEVDMYEKLIRAMDSTSADIVMCGYKSTNGSIFDNCNLPESFTGREFTELVIKDQIGSQLWKFVYKIELWDGVVSPHRRHAQDMMILHQVSNKAHKVVFVNENLYCYNDTRDDNISNSKKNLVKNNFDRALAFFGRADFCVEFNYSSDTRIDAVKQAVRFLINGFVNKSVFEERFKCDLKVLKDFVKKYHTDIKSSNMRKDYKYRAFLISLNPRVYLSLYRVLSLIKGK